MKRKLAGIYLIKHTSGFFYLGYSINIFERWNSHYTTIKIGTHSSPDFMNLWNSTVPSEWSFHILDTLSLTEFRKAHQVKGKQLDSLFRRTLLKKEKEWMSLYSKNLSLNKNNKYFS